MSVENRQGRVVAVLKSPDHAYPTFRQKSITVGEWGIEGDAHSGKTRKSFTNLGTIKENDRPISIVSGEAYGLLAATFGITPNPGAFNEQVLVAGDGLGYLDYVEVGDEVHFEGGVKIDAVDHAYPCQKLVKYLHLPSLRRASELFIEGKGQERRSKRGVLGRVLEQGVIEPGEGLTIVRKTLFNFTV